MQSWPVSIAVHYTYWVKAVLDHVARLDPVDAANWLEVIADVAAQRANEALRRGQPSIFNSDQGAQFTRTGFTGRLAQAGIRISLDGRGRAHNHIFVERLW